MKISYIVCCFVALLTAVIEAEAKPRGITVPFKKKILRKNRSFFEKRADASVAIYNHVDVSYIITIDIGTPPQSFDVSLNTAWYLSRTSFFFFARKYTHITIGLIHGFLELIVLVLSALLPGSMKAVRALSKA